MTSAERTRSIVARIEPFVLKQMYAFNATGKRFVKVSKDYEISYQARTMEFLFALLAGDFGKLIISTVHSHHANHTILHTLQMLIHIPLPQHQPIQQGTILHKEVTHCYNTNAEIAQFQKIPTYLES